MTDENKANRKKKKEVRHKTLAERIESLKARKQKYSEEHKSRMAKLTADIRKLKHKQLAEKKVAEKKKADAEKGRLLKDISGLDASDMEKLQELFKKNEQPE